MPDTLQLDDLTALRQYAQTRDPRAFEVLVHRYQALVYGTCQRQLRNPSDAEDATQETFVKLARKAGQIRSGVAGWLHACAVGTCRDLIRRNATRRRHEQTYGLDAAADKNRGAKESTWAKLGPEVDAAMDALSSADRALIAARFLTGTPQTELATAAGVSPSAIHQRIDRAVNRLRKTMSKRGFAVTGSALAVILGEAGAQAATVPAAVTGSLVKVGLAGIGGVQAGGAVAGGGVLAKLTSAFQGLSLAGKAAVIATVLAGGTGVGAVVMHTNPPTDATELATASTAWVDSPAIDRTAASSEAWLEGTWRLVEGYTNGIPIERLTLSGDTIRSAVTNPTNPGEEFELILRILKNDAQAQPAVMLVEVGRCTYPQPNMWRALVGKQIEVIYGVEGGRLTVRAFADGVGRPQNFDEQARPLLGWHGFMDPAVDQSDFTMDPGLNPLLAGQWRFIPDRYITFEQGRGTVHFPFYEGGGNQEFEILGYTPQTNSDGSFRIDSIITSAEPRLLVGRELPILVRFEGPDTLHTSHYEGLGFMLGLVPQSLELEQAPGHVIGQLIRVR